MSLRGEGVVAIWQDAPPGQRADYFEWHNREHMLERVRIPGFLRGRRYRAIRGEPEFFTLYEAQSLEVLTGPDYAGRLNNPTPWTRRVAPQLRNNVRSLCNVALSHGTGVGGLAMTWRYDVAPERQVEQRALVEKCLRRIADAQGVVGAHLCLADVAASSVETEEKKSRPARALTPGWVVIVEGAGDLPALEQAGTLLSTKALEEAGARGIATGLYQLQYLPG